jgi:hypothetical protein
MKPGRVIATLTAVLATLAAAGCGKAPAPPGEAAPSDAPLAPAPVPAVAAPPAASARPPLSGSVRTVVAAAGDVDIAARIAALRATGNQLTPDDQAALLSFLETTGPVPGLNLESTRWLKNDVMSLLAAQQQPSPKLAETLLRVYRDPNQDVVLRDYAVQHLGEWLRREPEALRRAEIETTLWDAVNGREGAIGGTALIALSRLAESGRMEPASRERLAGAALGLAQEGEVSAAVRATALQICARQTLSAALPLARQLAATEGDLSLRLSAVAALGRLGGTNDLDLLAQMAAGPEPRLQPAATAALKQLKFRTRPPQTASAGTGAPPAPRPARNP